MTNAEAGRSSGVQAIRVLFKAGMVAWIEVGSFEIVRLERSVDVGRSAVAGKEGKGCASTGGCGDAGPGI